MNHDMDWLGVYRKGGSSWGNMRHYAEAAVHPGWKQISGHVKWAQFHPHTALLDASRRSFLHDSEQKVEQISGRRGAHPVRIRTGRPAIR
jgi:hypothetical protein